MLGTSAAPAGVTDVLQVEPNSWQSSVQVIRQQEVG